MSNLHLEQQLESLKNALLAQQKEISLLNSVLEKKNDYIKVLESNGSLQRVREEKRMMEETFKLLNASTGENFSGNYYIHEVSQVNEKSLLIKASIQDCFFLKTNDDRKVDANGHKHSAVNILYLKKEFNDIPASFIRKGDVVYISGKQSYGFQEIMNGEEKTYKNLTHKFGFQMKPVKLTEETRQAISEFKKVESERIKQERENEKYVVDEVNDIEKELEKFRSENNYDINQMINSIKSTVLNQVSQEQSTTNNIENQVEETLEEMSEPVFIDVPPVVEETFVEPQETFNEPEVQSQEESKPQDSAPQESKNNSKNDKEEFEFEGELKLTNTLDFSWD